MRAKSGCLVGSIHAPHIRHRLHEITDDDSGVGYGARSHDVVADRPILLPQINRHDGNVFQIRLVPCDPIDEAVVKRAVGVNDERAAFAFVPLAMSCRTRCSSILDLPVPVEPQMYKCVERIWGVISRGTPLPSTMPSFREFP